jgi:tRNA-dihydrouridine synthase B
MLTIGSIQLKSNVLLAPMSGVTDLPFRRLVNKYGVGMVISEMIASRAMILETRQSLLKAKHDPEDSLRAVQLAGCDPEVMAEAAKFNVDLGASLIDINMGCPAKKVCNKLAGSALLQDEDLVARILDAVVAAVDVPVTLKTRLGFLNGEENILRVAKRAEDSGIAALALHGRTREDMYLNTARYELIREVKKNINIPLIANGDIDSPEKAKYVLDYTGADAVMIGRAAQGRPWIFREIAHYLETGEHLAAP